jgi:3'-phosphoadenosine 5'-phosphosulfate sulfotransferase (PAPS reductase)/FAD synthetase
MGGSMSQTKHIVFYSGGIGSFITAQRVIEKYGTDNTYLLFTDTLIEDKSLYTFLLETYNLLFGADVLELLTRVSLLEELHENPDERKKQLVALSHAVTEKLDHFVWLSDGRDPWDVFKDTRFLGNSRLAKCSHVLKQDMSRKYIVKNFAPETSVLYLGIDWTEQHRKKAPTANWFPYLVEFPMCEEPFLTKTEMITILHEHNIKLPALYEQGFTHNNCGGFCVRAGAGHFANLLKTNKPLYLYHERKELEFQEFIGSKVAILRDRRGGDTKPLTLHALRERLEKNQKDIDFSDVGGCGCFVTD